LIVPQEASNDYIYGPAKQGCAGIPETASEYDHQQIDNAFKLLTSKGSGTKELSYEDLQTTVQKRLGRPTDQQDLGAYMSGINEGEVRRNTKALSTTWTKARIASTTREVEWTFENTRPSVSFDGKTLHEKHRRSVLSSLRISQKAWHMTRLCEMPSQGKDMECIATDPASSHFFQTGLYTRFADWCFIHRARLNLLPLNGVRRNKQNNVNKCCWRCGYENETLPHVINHCMRYADLITRRHNAVVNRVKKAAEGKHTILAEN
jgi:hypothetical protein